MKEYKISNISFKSYMKIVLGIFLVSGLFFGLFFFIWGVIAQDTTLNGRSSEINTILVSSPLMFTVFGVFVGVVTYYPVCFLLQQCNGITLSLKDDNDTVETKK